MWARGRRALPGPDSAKRKGCVVQHVEVPRSSRWGHADDRAAVPGTDQDGP